MIFFLPLFVVQPKKRKNFGFRVFSISFGFCMHASMDKCCRSMHNYYFITEHARAIDKPSSVYSFQEIQNQLFYHLNLVRGVDHSLFERNDKC